MNLKRTSLLFVVTAAMAFPMASCSPKDADIKMAVENVLKDNPGVIVDVKDGVATLSGKFTDDASKAAAEAAIKSVKGVKSVVDNAAAAPPPAPVVLSPDDALKSAVATAIQGFSGLNASVQNGVVTLAGSVKKTDLPAVMKMLHALHPKNVINKATVIK